MTYGASAWDIFGSPVSKLSDDEMIRLAREQIDLATAGQTVASASNVVTPSGLVSAPTDTRRANAFVAYWLAVGARIGYANLLPAARRFVEEASGTFWASEDTAKIRSIVRDGVQALDAVGGVKDRRLAGIYKVFQIGGRIEDIDLSKQYAYETSYTYVVTEGTKDVGRKLKRVASGENPLAKKRPPGVPAWLWWLKQNAWIAVGVGAVGLVGFVYLRTVLTPVLAARRAAKALSGPKANPRRNRRSRR